MSSSNLEKARDNVRRLRLFLDDCRTGKKEIPLSGGRLNKSKVAKECGFLRGVLTENQECKELINAAVIEFGGESDNTATDELSNADVKRLERKVQQLETRIADLLVENHELKSQKNMSLFSDEWLGKTGWIIDGQST